MHLLSFKYVKYLFSIKMYKTDKIIYIKQLK